MVYIYIYIYIYTHARAHARTHISKSSGGLTFISTLHLVLWDGFALNAKYQRIDPIKKVETFPEINLVAYPTLSATGVSTELIKKKDIDIP